MSDTIKGVRVTLKINGNTLLDLDSEAMKAQSAYMVGGGIVHHQFRTHGGDVVVIEYAPEEITPRGDCNCELCG